MNLATFSTKKKIIFESVGSPVNLFQGRFFSIIKELSLSEAKILNYWTKIVNPTLDTYLTF